MFGSFVALTLAKKPPRNQAMSLAPLELQILKKAHELALTIERESKDAHFPEASLFELSGLLKTLETSANLEAQKLAEIPDHFFPSMTLKHFSNFIVPIERALDRNLRDDQFLITDRDTSTTAAGGTAPKAFTSQKVPLYFVLDNMRSAFNVGSIFRLADCVGASEILLCGYTATPENETLQKTSLGSWQNTRWQSFPHLKEAFAYLESLKVQIVALETAEKSSNLYDLHLTTPTAFVVGNERFGLDREILEISHKVASLPVWGQKNSLNVSNALSIAAYEWRRQWQAHR
jgi:tRNA G18 (ribose-2'-O)-methylase SpoU